MFHVKQMKFCFLDKKDSVLQPIAHPNVSLYSQKTLNFVIKSQVF